MIKSILIICRRDPTEAMRVAAGLTIYDHRLSLVFMVAVPDTPRNREMAELLEFSDIEPMSTVSAETAFPAIDADALASAILEADAVINT
jgi:hypothetical protein